MDQKQAVKNAADEEQVKKAERNEKYARKQFIDDLRELLKSGPGRRVLWHYIRKCGVLRSEWEASARLHFTEGCRFVGIKMMQDAREADPHAFSDLLTRGIGDWAL